MLNVDEFPYCQPKRCLPRCVALDLDAMQVDTPWVHVFKSKAFPSHKEQEKISTITVLNVDEFLYCQPKRFLPRCVELELDAMQVDTPWAHVFKSKAFPTHKEQEKNINNKGAEC